MRPEKIELQYFGPYEHELIDFNQFRDQSLFLVAGNTGAGKTTIFDAMCYALFGQTTNDRDRSAAALRSDFAPADKETKVTFTFTHQGKQYQVMRRPKQTLVGRRGNLVEHNQAVSLIFPLDSATPHEITKIKEVDTFITDLLNLNRDQFKQIVLLPQGKFRQFLDSDSNTKEALLRDLFNTGLYEQWTAKLKEQLGAQKKDLAAQETKLQSIKENISAVDPQLTMPEWLAAVDTLISQLAAQLTELHKSEKDQQARVTALTARLHDEQELQAQLTALSAAHKVAMALAEQKEKVTSQQKQLADLQWFQKHQAAYQRWQDGEQRLATLKQERNQLATKKAQLGPQLSQAMTKLAELTKQQPAHEKLKQQAADLTAKLPLFTTVTKLKATVADLKKDQAAVTAKQQQKKGQIADCEKSLAALATKIQDSGDLAAKKVALNKRQLQHQQLREKVTAYQTVAAELNRAQANIGDLTDTVQQRKEIVATKQAALTELNDRYARHQIALLATKLKPGSPCPVCGAIDHPQPAHIADDEELVTDAQLKHATAELQEEQQEYSRCQEQLFQAQKQVEKLNKQAGDAKKAVADLLLMPDLPTDWQERVQAQTAALDRDQAALKKEEQQLATWQDQQTTQQAQLVAWQNQLKQFNQQCQQVDQEVVKQQTRLTEKQAALPGDFADEAAAQATLKDYQQQLVSFDKVLADGQQQVQTLKQVQAVTTSQLAKTQADQEKQAQQQEERHEKLVAILDHDHPGETWDFWEQVAAALPNLDALQSAIRDYETRCHDNEQEQERLKEAIKGRTQPDLTVTQEKLQAANEQLRKCQQEIGQLSGKQQEVQASQQRATKILDRTDALNRQLNQLQTLTDVVAGNTENHLSLERYVLQSYFRDVLAAANLQLARLTNGRYQFELSQESHGAGAKWSGLEVSVYDDNAGRTRSARTLSGGESFMASLALALALCQIIQEQSGGISIEALFIDEGFGSLDQQALADALHALQELEGHRMIGIISHVTELEEQIPDQLRVTAVNGRSKVSYRHEF